MGTRVGTSHFVSRDAAYDYYAQYEVGSYTSSIHGGKTRNDAALSALLDNKIADGEIHIGAPVVRDGERLLVDRSEGRYFIESD